MSLKHTNSAVATTQEDTGELQIAADAAQAQTEVQGAMIFAKKYPRNEQEAYLKLMQSTKRPSFAAKCAYKFPRGTREITGPSVKLAREAKRTWGNLWTGFAVVHETPISRKIRAMAWDLESGNREFAEDEFRKLIYRKEGGWIEPDERDLRELTNRRAAILERNCILKLLPPDFIEDALYSAAQTARDRAAKDPASLRKELLVRLGTLSIPLAGVEQRMGHPFAEATSDELVDLEAILQSIEEGNSKWSDYVVAPADPEPKKQNLSEHLKAKAEQAATPPKPEPAPPVRQTVPPPPSQSIAPLIELGVHTGKHIDDPSVPTATLSQLADHYLMLIEDPRKKAYLSRHREMHSAIQAELEKRYSQG